MSSSSPPARRLVIALEVLAVVIAMLAGADLSLVWVPPRRGKYRGVAWRSERDSLQALVVLLVVLLLKHLLWSEAFAWPARQLARILGSA